MNQTNSQSAIGRIKARNSLKRQRLAVFLLIGTVALLILALLVVSYLVDIYSFEDLDGTTYQIKKIDGLYALCYKSGDKCDVNSDGYYQTALGTQVQIDAETGESKIYAVVDTEGTEVVGYGQYVLMFKQLTYDASSTKDVSKVIKSIEVHNEYGGYTFLRGEGNNFYIKEHEAANVEKETFAQLAVACGYTLSMRRLDAPEKLPDGSIDYAEYGLAPEKRIKTETDAEGNEIETEYDYVPAYYVITTMIDEQYKVTLGDLAVTGGGYYARFEGRDTIYILGTSGFSDVLLQRVEDIVTPMIVYPMGSTTYFDVHHFMIYEDIDYEAIYAELMEKFGDPDAEDFKVDEEAFYEEYSRLFEKYSNKACHFSYQDLTEREGSMYSYLPYVSELEYAGGYYINSNNIDKVLYELYDTDFTSVEKLAPTDEDFEKYGLDNAAYAISYYFKTTDENGETVYIGNYVEVSEKNENGIFYAYSSMYDMIVGVSESSFDFLEWEELAWYDQSYIQLDISHVEEIWIESSEYSVHFEIDDSASKYMTYIAQSGSSFTEGDKTYSIAKDSETGLYTLQCGGKAVSAVYTGDYLVAPLPYVKGTAESDQYLFVETQNVDLDGDGETGGSADGILYYFYNVVQNEKGEYALAAYVTIADMQGNKLRETSMYGEIAFSTDYFLTNSHYLYLTTKDSYVGSELDRIYGSANRGKWCKGDFYITSSGQYLLVNKETGEWSKVSDLSGAVYFADSETSSFVKRAVEIPGKYDASGKPTRHPETYYPTTEERLQYNEETGKIEVYSTKNKTWKNASYSDCTIGIWNSGAYYLTANNNIVVINQKTGDWGFATMTENENYVAEIKADGIVLDYVIQVTNHVNRVENASATDNFKQFYKGLLYASLEGMAELSEEEKAALRAQDNFTSDASDNPCQLKITVLGCDQQGNRRDVVYRFYQYTERKSYLTIELLTESPDGSVSTQAYGNFYVLRTFADKIIEDAYKVSHEQEVTAITKY